MERLQKVLAQCGIASRRKCEKIILEGRVKVNGKVVTQLGTKVHENDRIEVDGKPVVRKNEKIYVLFNKPKGCITTVYDPFGRKTVMDYLNKFKDYRIFPVGRLDRDTEGLLLLTNDGQLSFALTHPSHQVEKTYLVEINGTPSKKQLERLSQGVYLEDGKTLPAETELIRGGRRSLVKITIREGRKRQIRRMFKAIGFSVLNLKRIKFGPLVLKDLKPGEYRLLKESEISKLKELEKHVYKMKKEKNIHRGDGTEQEK
ncbi:MAG TPA: pseudouridine synthase [Peptococcaceae bacterium]|nr:MAG: Pseudouridine synthase [Clostridia bacterium 41_269]HBT20497.1 pseudouridine synthase [Peptococcaceae bacterium]